MVSSPFLISIYNTHHLRFKTFRNGDLDSGVIIWELRHKMRKKVQKSNFLASNDEMNKVSVVRKVTSSELIPLLLKANGTNNN